jgi:phage tail-like protein
MTKIGRNRTLRWALAVFLALIFTSLWSADFSVNPYRFDPYKQSKFRVKWDGKYIPGILSVDGLHREFHVVETTGQDFKRSPGKAVYRPIRIERTRTHDTAFEDWVENVRNFTENRGNAPREFRKAIIIELLNESGQTAMAFLVYGCWPSKYSAIKSLDSNRTETAVEAIELEYESWERDTNVGEPAQQ